MFLRAPRYGMINAVAVRTAQEGSASLPAGAASRRTQTYNLYRRLRLTGPENARLPLYIRQPAVPASSSYQICYSLLIEICHVVLRV